MIDNSINNRVAHIYSIWRKYRKGKKLTREIAEFEYSLIDNLYALAWALENKTWSHGGYRHFWVSENKQRLISVASVRDKIVHRCVYERLSREVDRYIIKDVWSSRKGRGLHRAIARTQILARVHHRHYVLKIDIKKFFKNIDQEILYHKIYNLSYIDDETKELCKKIIFSYNKNTKKGIPIGNVTSQIFSHIYLLELDKFIMNSYLSIAYTRYGDDMLCIVKDKKSGILLKSQIRSCLSQRLLCINEESSYIRKLGKGVDFLGSMIYKRGRKLKFRSRYISRISLRNQANYIDISRKNDTKLYDILKWYEAF